MRLTASGQRNTNPGVKPLHSSSTTCKQLLCQLQFHPNRLIIELQYSVYCCCRVILISLWLIPSRACDSLLLQTLTRLPTFQRFQNWPTCQSGRRRSKKKKRRKWDEVVKRAHSLELVTKETSSHAPSLSRKEVSRMLKSRLGLCWMFPFLSQLLTSLFKPVVFSV